MQHSRQECDCGNAWYRITDNRDQSRLECRTCLPNRKSQTGGYYKDDNKIDFRVFLGLNISLKSIHKDFAIFNTENSFLGKLGPNLTQWLEMGGLAQRKESSFRSLSYPPSMHLSFTFNNHFLFSLLSLLFLLFSFSLAFAFSFSLIRTFVRARSSRWSIFFLYLVVTRIEVTYNRFML